MNQGDFLRIRSGLFGLATLLFFLQAEKPAAAQHFSIGADFVSRYVWRGTDYGEAASIQPVLSFSGGGFEVGTWASYAIDPEAAGVNEHDLWMGYTVETGGAGSVSFGVTDYYFPSPDGAGFFDFDGDGDGAHWVEPFASYTAPGSVPVTLYGAVFAHNDPDNSVYLEAAAPIRVDGVVLGLTAGVVAGKSELYGTDGAAIVNLGISASKEIPLTEQFSLPISVTYILNPDAERSFLVFGITL